MTDAFIYDHLRSPRGRGKAGGALNSITPINLATQVLAGLRDRNQLDTSILDDVILGCVAPVGEQGANVARVAAMNADYAESVPGKQINRFCASGLEAVNAGASQVMAGQAMAVVAGGLESMSRVPMMSDGGAWAIDPQIAYHTYFVPQGISADLIATLHGISREDCDAYAVASQHRAAHSRRDLSAKAFPPTLGVEIYHLCAAAVLLGRGRGERHCSGIGFELGTAAILAVVDHNRLARVRCTCSLSRAAQ